MTYEDIVFDYNNRALNARTWDMISDRERVEFVLWMKGRQEPVAWHTDDFLSDKSATTYDHDVMKRWELKGWPITAHYTTPQPCPECDEKQSAIDVWEGRYADKTAECEKRKAEIDLTNTLAQQSNQDHLNVRKDYQGEIIKLKAERDELAAQNQVLRNMVSEVRDPMDMSELPDLSTGILNRVRAEVAERCAEVCDVHATGWKASPGCNPMAGFVASSNCATDICALSHDMEAGK